MFVEVTGGKLVEGGLPPILSRVYSIQDCLKNKHKLANI